MVEKIDELAEKLVEKVDDKLGGFSEIQISGNGEIKVQKRPQFLVLTEDMDEIEEAEEHRFPRYVGQREGKKAFQKLDISVEDGKINVKDTDSLLDAKEYLVRKMLQKEDLDYKVEELAMPTFNKLSNYYLQQVVEAEKKKEV